MAQGNNATVFERYVPLGDTIWDSTPVSASKLLKNGQVAGGSKSSAIELESTWEGHFLHAPATLKSRIYSGTAWGRVEESGDALEADLIAEITGDYRFELFQGILEVHANA